MGLRWLQKLVRNGNSTMVTIPVQMLRYCGFVSGQKVILEPQEDRSIVIRAPRPSDVLEQSLLNYESHEHRS